MSAAAYDVRRAGDGAALDAAQQLLEVLRALNRDDAVTGLLRLLDLPTTGDLVASIGDEEVRVRWASLLVRLAELRKRPVRA